MQTKTVLVTGANGFLGNATAKYFALQGWKTYGMIRSPDHVSDLAANEVIPIVGSYSDTTSLDGIKGVIFDVIISTTEDWSDYVSHFNDIIRLVKVASEAANAAGRKPLLMFTSGNKDYGGSGLHGSPDLVWSEEDSPLNPHPFIAPRANTVSQVFNHSDHFHATIFRPCMIYGRKGSIYGSIMAQAAASDQIVFHGSPDTIWHGIHVDDVGSAYFAVATEVKPEKAHGQVFTVGNDDYDTYRQLADGVSKAYGGKKIVFKPLDKNNVMQDLTALSQPLRSERLRSMTGWRPRKLPFLEGIEQYRAAFDVAFKERDPAIMKILGFWKMGDEKKEDMAASEKGAEEKEEGTDQ